MFPPTMKRFDKNTFELTPNTVFWDHPDPLQEDFLSPKTKILVLPETSLGTNYKPKKSDWQRIPWVHSRLLSRL